MSAGLLLATLLAAAGAVPLHAGERTPIAIVVLQPGTSDPALPARIAAAADRAWHDDTGLAPRIASALGVDAASIATCPPRRLLACAMTAIHGVPIPALLIASVLRLSDGRAQLSAWVIDVPRAQQLIEDARTSGESDTTVDNRLFRMSLVGPSTEVTLADDAALSAYFRALQADLPAFAQPLGSFEIVAPWSPGRLVLDDRPLGPIEGTATVDEVRPGLRRVEVIDPTGAAHAREIDVKSGRLTRVSLATESEPLVLVPESYETSRTALDIAGLAMVAGGLAMVTIGAAISGSVHQACLARLGTEPECASLGAPTFGFDTSAGPTNDPGVLNPGVIAPLPLGFALGTAGVSWVLGLLLLGDDEDPPWLVAAGGLALGALVYGIVSAAAAP